MGAVRADQRTPSLHIRIRTTPPQLRAAERVYVQLLSVVRMRHLLLRPLDFEWICDCDQLF